jgi:hypothetical protein
MVLYILFFLSFSSSLTAGWLHDFFHKSETERTSTIQDTHTELAAALKTVSNSPGAVIVVNYNKLDNKEEHKTTASHVSTTNDKNEKTRKADTAYPLSAWIHTHKLRCFLYGLGTSYISFQGYLWYLSAFLNNNKLWSQWHQQKPLEEMYKVPQDELAYQLLTDIRLRYNHSLTTPNTTSQIAYFTQDTQREIDLLKRYFMFSQVLRTFWIQKLFFFNASLLENIPIRLQRIYYLRETLLSWYKKQTHSA